ncbi:kelch-like protein 10 [Engystomops pustulosus]|uniref:kelch-like protein 10 n=1 Tax=Engystomops pustulosus TaxID=76066 RepID=UPI003AFABE2A
MDHNVNQMDFNVCNELRLDGKLCDVVIKASGVEFLAHKDILCDCSPYFRVLFTYSGHKTNKKVYDIPGISPDVMKLILDYAYTKVAHINTDNVEDLFIAADYLNILDLVQFCSNFLRNQLCPQNCIGIYKFATFFYCRELQREALMYIHYNYDIIMKTSDEILDLSTLQLKGLVEEDTVNPEQKEETF